MFFVFPLSYPFPFSRFVFIFATGPRWVLKICTLWQSDFPSYSLGNIMISSAIWKKHEWVFQRLQNSTRPKDVPQQGLVITSSPNQCHHYYLVAATAFIFMPINVNQFKVSCLRILSLYIGSIMFMSKLSIATYCIFLSVQ